jgi:uncharacterized membrane protein
MDDPQFRQIQQQLRELAEANSALTRRVFQLETDVARLQHGDRSVEHAPAVAVPPPLPPPPPLPHPMSAPPTAMPPVPPQFEPEAVAASAIVEPIPADTPESIESNVGLKWINRIGVITVMLGVAFFFKYAVDNDWIGPAGRVILGVLAGLGAIFAGDRLWHKGQKVFAQGIQALGSSILYLAFFAAYSFYQLIPQQAAFVLMLAVTVMTGALSLRYNARATLLLALFSGYATPFMLSKGEPHDLFFLSYMLVLNAGTMFVARLRDWKSVELIAFLGAWFMQGAWAGDRAEKYSRHAGALFTVLNYIVSVTSPNLWIILIGQAAASIVLAICYLHSWEATQPALLGLFAAGLAVAWRKDIPALAAVATAAFWFSQAVADLPDQAQHVTELLISYTIVFIAVLGWNVVRNSAEKLHKLDLLTAAGSGVIYYAATYELLDDEYKAYLGLFTVAVAASYLALGYVLYMNTPAEKRDKTGPLLAAGLALAFLALAVPVQLTGFRITLGWAIQSAALTFIAYKLKDWRILCGSAILAFLAVGHLTGEDAHLYWPPIEGGYTLLFNPRFISFLVVFISLLLSAYWASKMEGIPRVAAAVPYLVAHILLIFGIHTELFAYIESRPDLLAKTSLKTLASSLIFAGYGFQFIASGFARRSAFPRVLGLILFAIVIFKLYIYDIWLLDVTYRMIAFIALGGLLLAGSYLYSRYRDKLSTLIRDA